MARRSLIPFLALALFICTAGSVPPELPEDEDVRLCVDGQRVYTENLASWEDGALWVPLRPVSEALGADEVSWDEGTMTASILAPGLKLDAPVGAMYITANGRYFYAPGGVRLRGGRTMVPLTALARAFGADVTRSPDGTVSVVSGEAPVDSGDSFYGSDDLYWLSRIIEAEAGGEPFVGKIAVGNVVMERTLAPEFPDTVEEVIFDRRYGVQFTPAYSGSIYNSPSADSIIAAKLALEGEYVVHALYFASRQAAEYCWAARNCQEVADLWGHVFYA